MKSTKLPLLFGGLLLVVLVVLIWSLQPQSTKLMFVGWGGSTQEALKQKMFAPFADQMGAPFSEDTYDGNLELLRQQATAQRGKWDVVETETTVMLQASADGFLSDISDVTKAVDGLKRDAVRKDAVGLFEWWTVLAWNKTRLPANVPIPKDWKDFWDLKTYPGSRGMRKSPRTALEIALLADGVDPVSLYPLDLDRAFKKLDEIKSSIVWWTTGADQQTRLLSEYVMTTAWNGRIVPMKKSGAPVEMSFDLALTDRDWWVVPQNAPHAKLARDFVKFSAGPRAQADFATASGYGPVNEKALDLMDYAALAMLPPKTARLVEFNANWWLENEPSVLDRWNQWLLK